MRPLWCGLVLIVGGLASGCSTVDEQPAPEPSRAAQPPTSALEAAEPRPYRLVLDVLFEYERAYNARIGMQLALTGQLTAAGQQFAVVRQEHPSHLVFTWSEGLVRKTWHADVKWAVEQTDTAAGFDNDGNRDFRRGLAHGEALLAQWRRDHSELLDGRKWVFKPAIPFRMDAPIADKYRFRLGHDGALPLDARGRPQAGVVEDQLELVYRWHEPGKPDPTANPEFFEALTSALAVLDVSPFPEGRPATLASRAPGASWTARSEHAIGGLVRAARGINPDVAKLLDENLRLTIPLRFELIGRTGDVSELLGVAADIPDPVVGQGYRVVSMRRRVRWDGRRRMTLLDEVEIVGRGEGGDRMELRFSLTDIQEATQ